MNKTSTAQLFGTPGAPRKGSHADVILLRLSGKSSSETAGSTDYQIRWIKEIMRKFKERVLPKLLQLHADGYESSVIAGELELPVAIVELAIEKFGPRA